MREIVVCFLLATLTVTAYWRVGQCEFVALDDAVYVQDNPHVLGGLTLPDVAWAFTTGETGNWHPLTWLTLMLDVNGFGVDSAVHHGVNLALHVVNTLLLFGFLRWTTQRTGPSAMVAALFAVHPLHVESVAWVSERKDVLSTAFGFLALWAYAAYARRPRVGMYLVVFLLLAMALMSKPMWVTFPFMLMLLDYWPLGRPGAAEPRFRPASDRSRNKKASERTPSYPQQNTMWQLIAEKAPLMALSVASCIVTCLVQQRAGAMRSATGLSLAVRIENSLLAYGTYLIKAIWPCNLAVLYPLSTEHNQALVIGSAALLAAISAAVWAGRKRPYLVVGWCWYLGTLIPVIGLVQVGNQALADRYTYVPLIGVAIMVTWAMADLLDRLPGRAGLWAAVAIATSLLCVLTALTIRQVHYWVDSKTLLTHCLDVTPDNALAHSTLGAVLAAQVETRPEAIQHYLEALRIMPQLTGARVDLAIVLSAEKRLNEAIQQCNEALRLDPGDSRAHNCLGKCLALQGEKQAAIGQFRTAVKLDLQNAEAYYNLGLALSETGEKPAAIEAFRNSLRIKPLRAATHFNLARILADMGEKKQAIAEFRVAAALAAAQGQTELANASLSRAKLFMTGPTN
jgi:protein O-mannosyl-transferase